MRRVIVTGGAGFIGSNLVRLLVKEKGIEVLSLDKLTYAANVASLSDLDSLPKYQFKQLDLANNYQEIFEVLRSYRPDSIIHLAAESHVDRSISSPEGFVRSNILGTYNLLQASLQYWLELSLSSSNDDNNPRSSSSACPSKGSFRFLHVSTDEVYGSLHANEVYRFSEATPYRPRSPYSASKAASDHLVCAWHITYGLPTLLTHCTNNYGPYQFPEKLIPVVILKCLKCRPIPVYGRGQNVRDWIYVEDHVGALCAVVEKGRAGETYNIGGGCERRNIDLVIQVCSLMDELVPQLAPDLNLLPSGSRYESLITYVGDRPGHDFRLAIDASKIRNELGWEPTTNFDSGLRETVHWYLVNRDWWENALNNDPI